MGDRSLIRPATTKPNPITIMLEQQKKLLAEIAAAHRTALRLYNSGVKISGVVTKLRAAGDELETRVRYLEREVKSAKAAKAAPVAAAAVGE